MLQGKRVASSKGRTVGVWLSPSELARLDDLAAKARRSRSQVLRLLLLGVEVGEAKSARGGGER